MTGPTISNPNETGPLDRRTALALLRSADGLLAASEFGAAQAHYQRLIGSADPAITGAALIGAGEALYRLDDERSARAYWEQAAKLEENPSTYAAWRQVAAARVRDGELRGALDAYREAERRAPAQEQAEIAQRLGWLSKEDLGDPKAAGRYFARSRGRELLPILSYGLLAVTVVISFVAMQPEMGDRMFNALELDKRALAAGEWWRLVSPVLVHAGIAHLFFNMYFLFLVGPLVEQLYGSARFGLFYVLTAATASTASYLFGGPAPSVGASGALMGLCGVLLATRLLHRPAMRGAQRALLSQIGMLVAINLALGFGLDALGTGIDNMAHLGGLVGGFWLGLLVPPIGARAMPTIGRRPGGGMPGSRTDAVTGSGRSAGATAAPNLPLAVIRWAGVAAVVPLVVWLVLAGASRFQP